MAKRPEPLRGKTERGRRHPDGPTARRATDTAVRRPRPAKDQRPVRSAPRTGPIARPADAPARPKSAAQAKARAKARKAKAPKVVRPPLRERLLLKLSSIELDPRRYVTRVPFVVLVIGALGVGLGVTLWLSTDAAERSYQLGHARELNQALLQQKEALERQVLEAQAAPALAESARGLGMIPSRDTAHLVQDPAGTWVVVGTPKPAAGISPPPLNSPLPEPAPPAPPPAPAPRVVDPREMAVHLPAAPQATNPSMPASPLGLPGAPGAVPAPGAIPAPGLPAAAPGLPAAAPGAPVAPADVPAAPSADGTVHSATPTLPGPPPSIELPTAGAPA